MRRYPVVDEVIRSYGLHADDLPVNLTALEDVFWPDPMDLSGAGVEGWVVQPLAFPPTEEDPARVVVNAARSKALQRVIYAHEVGHVLLEHAGSLETREACEAFEDLHEREAWAVAVELLIPEWAGKADQRLLALECEVPVWMVRVWQGLPWPDLSRYPMGSREWWQEL